MQNGFSRDPLKKSSPPLLDWSADAGELPIDDPGCAQTAALNHLKNILIGLNFQLDEMNRNPHHTLRLINGIPPFASQDDFRRQTP
jgi:hypothetical protein